MIEDDYDNTLKGILQTPVMEKRPITVIGDSGFKLDKCLFGLSVFDFVFEKYAKDKRSRNQKEKNQKMKISKSVSGVFAFQSFPFILLL